MELEAKIRKASKGGPPDWVVECPMLDIMTQGNSREDAIEMLRLAIVELMEWYFQKAPSEQLDIFIRDIGNLRIGVSCNDVSILMSFVLIRQREMSGLNLREAAKQLGSSSPNAYKRYENGDIKISMVKFDALIHAVNPKRQLVVNVV